MARDISSGFQTEIEAQQLNPIILYKAEFDSGDLLLWTGYGDIDYDGDTYVGSGDLLKMSQVEETQDLVANGVTFELTGVNTSIVSLALNEEYQNRPITVYFGVLDDAGDLINDPYLMFKGVMDVMSISDDGSDSVIRVNTESELSDMREGRARNYTPEDQKSEYPNDKGLEFVPTVQDIVLTWGSGL